MAIVVEEVGEGKRIRTRRTLPALDQDRRALAASCIPLAAGVARRVTRRRRVPLEEALAVSFLAVAEAASRFEPGRDIPFPAYAALVARSKLSEAADRHHRHAAHTVNHAEDFDQEQISDGREPEPDQVVSTAEVIARLRVYLRPLDFQLLWDVFALDQSMTDIARGKGLSKQRVSQLAADAIRKARRVCPELCRQ